MRLTDLTIKHLQGREDGAVIYHDSVLPGFGVRVSGGTKSFVLTHGKLRKRETIGRVGVLKLSDARAEAKRRLAEYTLGKSAPVSVAWNTAVATFLEEGRRRLKPRTHKDYERLLKKHFRLGELKVCEVNHIEIERRIARLSHTPVEQQHAFVVVRTFFRWAHRKHYTDRNPMERMESRFRYKPRERILTDDELLKVWNAANDDTFGTIVKLLILTGQRSGEIKTLTCKMIGKDAITLPDTKNGRSHTFPTAPLARALLTHIPFGALPNFARCKAALDRRSAVAGWTLHDLRRTFASGLQRLGVRLEVTEALLNHVSGSRAGIVRVYQTYDYAKEKRAAIELWESHITELTRPTGSHVERHFYQEG